MQIRSSERGVVFISPINCRHIEIKSGMAIGLNAEILFSPRNNIVNATASATVGRNRTRVDVDRKSLQSECHRGSGEQLRNISLKEKHPSTGVWT